MRAVVCTHFGKSLSLGKAETPVVSQGEVLVKISAATITPSDVSSMGALRIVRLLSGAVRPKEAIPGVEFAGEIAEVGKGVRRFKTGDQVCGASLGFGAWAEYIRMPEDGMLTKRPANMDDAEAVGLCDGGITALLFLRDRARISSGQKILVNGASGCVGSFAVQLARHYGALVTGVCSTPNVELVRSFGADTVIDYTKEDFTLLGQTYDIIFDAVGKSSFSRCKPILTDNGVYLTTIPSPYVMLQKLFLSQKKGGKRADFTAAGLAKTKVRANALEMLIRLAEEGALKPVVDKRYPLEEINKALCYVAKGHKTGTVAVTP
jgi:NADPH:quinone reductase-like Zn-dependent oxidoreductase